MSGCCEAPDFSGQDPRYKRALIAVIFINATMFFVEFIAGSFAGSQALKADALDFLGDSITYGLSLWAISKTLETRAKVSLAKGFSLLGMGLWVLGATTYQVFQEGVPQAQVMGVVGLMALAANLISVVILIRFREGDSNVQSVWICSRNDALGNVAVLIASVAVVYTGSAWPDLVVAAIMASLFLSGAYTIIRAAQNELSIARSTQTAT